MPNFELYERRGHRPTRRVAASVTVLRTGALAFSRSAIEKLGNPDAIVLLVDRDEKLIGFRKATRAARNARAVRSNRGSAHLVSARALCRYMETDASESRRYPLLEIEGTPCIDLKQPGTVVTR